MAAPGNKVIFWDTAKRLGFRGMRCASEDALKELCDLAVLAIRRGRLRRTKFNLHLKGMCALQDEVVHYLLHHRVAIYTTYDFSPVAHNGVRGKKIPRK